MLYIGNVADSIIVVFVDIADTCIIILIFVSRESILSGDCKIVERIALLARHELTIELAGRHVCKHIHIIGGRGYTAFNLSLDSQIGHEVDAGVTYVEVSSILTVSREVACGIVHCGYTLLFRLGFCSSMVLVTPSYIYATLIGCLITPMFSTGEGVAVDIPEMGIGADVGHSHSCADLINGCFTIEVGNNRRHIGSYTDDGMVDLLIITSTYTLPAAHCALRHCKHADTARSVPEVGILDVILTVGCVIVHIIDVGHVGTCREVGTVIGSRFDPALVDILVELTAICRACDVNLCAVLDKHGFVISGVPLDRTCGGFEVPVSQMFVGDTHKQCTERFYHGFGFVLVLVKPVTHMACVGSDFVKSDDGSLGCQVNAKP